MKKIEIARARMMVTSNHVFFATLMMSVPMVEDSSIPTAATDMETIFYNPKFIESLDIETIQFVIMHELSHIILKHGIRKGGRDHELWNVACDYAVNIWLKDGGHKLWPKCYVSADYRGMSAEQIYQEQESNGAQDGSSPSGDGIGGDLIYKPMSEQKAREVEAAINGKIAAAAQFARQQGKMPADLDRFITELIHPQVPWNDLLRDLMQSYAPNEESWSRRNRRSRQYVLPSRYSPRFGELVVIGDTSASIGDKELAMIATEINAVSEQLNPERIRVIWSNDKECAAEQVFEAGEQVVLRPVGNGGTDMRKPLSYVAQFEPIVCVLITDGYTPWPERATEFPLIVVTTEEPGPNWSQTVKVKV